MNTRKFLCWFLFSLLEPQKLSWISVIHDSFSVILKQPWKFSPCSLLSSLYLKHFTFSFTWPEYFFFKKKLFFSCLGHRSCDIMLYLWSHLKMGHIVVGSLWDGSWWSLSFVIHALECSLYLIYGKWLMSLLRLSYKEISPSCLLSPALSGSHGSQLPSCEPLYGEAYVVRNWGKPLKWLR